jgi:hypothetical protein
MNKAGIDAIENALTNAEDNLARANMQKRYDLRWTNDMGESIDEVIKGYEDEVKELKKALNQAKMSG